MDHSTIVADGARGYPLGMSKTERVVIYVSPERKERLQVLAADLALQGGASVSNFVNLRLDEWEAANPEEVRRADRRMRELKRRRE
jgi:hypothetical protein